MTTSGPIDPSNASQRDNWDGDGGAFWAEHIYRFEGGTAAYRPAFHAAAAVQTTDVVLDVGCGAGRTTIEAARAAPDGEALGVDLSGPMLAIARRRAEDQGVTNTGFMHADAQVHPFEPASVDVVASWHGSMFFGDPVAAFTNIGRALRPGGRLALLTWQPLGLQEWMRSFFGALAAGREPFAPPADGPSPLGLSDPQRVRTLLGTAGFTGVELTDLREPMWFGVDAEDAFAFVAGHHAWMLRDLDDDARAGALDELRADLAAHLGDDGVTYESACWLVTARRP